VQYNLGVHIQYYVTVNYDGFIQAIDVIGGVELDVPETINDPTYPDRCYGHDPFYLEAGYHQLNGELALKYARTRATSGVDFDRAARQQALMMAALDKVLDQNVTLLARAPELWTTFEENVTTSMSYQEVIGLALLMKEIPKENIHRAVIDYNYVRDYTAPDGQRVLIPIRERIRDLRDDFFSARIVSTPEDLETQMLNEAAEVMVLNGTWTPGLAGSTAEYLETKGMIVAGVGDSEDKNVTETWIVDYSDKSATVNFLAQLLNVTPANIFSGSDPDGDYDIKVVLGTDWQLPAE
jgi:anionic cell wall polymer biosynthesis LytR-Cps2A-Psr (LCP) family protein